jgi:hypothetical protein
MLSIFLVKKQKSHNIVIDIYMYMKFILAVLELVSYGLYLYEDWYLLWTSVVSYDCLDLQDCGLEKMYTSSNTARDTRYCKPCKVKGQH